MAATEGNSFPAWAQPAQLRFVSSADLRCPNCNSTHLKKVSLAYQEGLFCAVAHTRFSAAAVGGHGPGLIVGKATTRGFHQSVLSKRLKPPVNGRTESRFSGGRWPFSRSAGSSSTYQKFCCNFFASVDPSRVVVCCHVPTVAGSLLEASIRPRTSVGILSGNARSSASAVAL